MNCSHLEKNPEDIDLPSGVSIVGLSVGLLAAAAVSSAFSLSALIPVAVETVLISFRVGAHVAKIAELLQHDNQTSAFWACELPGVDERKLEASLDTFNQSLVSTLCLSFTLANVSVFA